MAKVRIIGEDFWIDGKPTYSGRSWNGHRVEGLLLNSRMVQAIFDDENPETRAAWSYPDTGEWDPDRNVEEFCAALPEYRRHGLLAVTVGLQGGGSVYSSPVYEQYLASAFRRDGTMKPDWAGRLTKVLAAADAVGMAVIVNFFYWRQERFDSDPAILRATREAMEFLMESGRENLLIDLKNEVQPGDGLLQFGRIHEPLSLLHQIRGDAPGPLIGTSTFPKRHLEPGAWRELVEFWMPHGNDSTATQLAEEIAEVRTLPEHQDRPRPILINEDSIHVDNLDAAVAAGASWGYYDQGYGSDGYHGRFDWRTQGREPVYAELSGFQTLPVNWGINTEHKRAFFGRVAEITGVA